MVLLFSAELALQPFVTFYSKDGQSSILAGLSHSEEDGPQDTLCRYTDRQQHLGKGQDIERDATQ